jgi:hypothetical protein
MIGIYERQGMEGAQRVGLWDEEAGWIEGSDRLSFENDEEYSEELMMERFDGPSLFASSVDEEEVYEPEVDKDGSSIGKPIAGTLAEYDTVTVDTEDEEEEEDVEPSEKSQENVGEKVYVDSPQDAPNDKIVHVDVDDEGDPQEAYYYESER